MLLNLYLGKEREGEEWEGKLGDWRVQYEWKTCEGEFILKWKRDCILKWEEQESVLKWEPGLLDSAPCSAPASKAGETVAFTFSEVGFSHL